MPRDRRRRAAPGKGRAPSSNRVAQIPAAPLTATYAEAFQAEDRRDQISIDTARRIARRCVTDAVDEALGEVARQQGGLADPIGLEARIRGIAAGGALVTHMTDGTVAVYETDPVGAPIRLSSQDRDVLLHMREGLQYSGAFLALIDQLLTLPALGANVDDLISDGRKYDDEMTPPNWLALTPLRLERAIDVNGVAWMRNNLGRLLDLCVDSEAWRMSLITERATSARLTRERDAARSELAARVTP